MQERGKGRRDRDCEPVILLSKGINFHNISYFLVVIEFL